MSNLSVIIQSLTKYLNNQIKSEDVLRIKSDIESIEIDKIPQAYSNQINRAIKFLSRLKISGELEANQVEKIKKTIRKVITILDEAILIDTTTKIEFLDSSDSLDVESSLETSTSIVSLEESFSTQNYISEEDINIHQMTDVDLKNQEEFNIEETLGGEFLVKFANIQLGNLDNFEQAILEFESGSSEAIDVINRILHTLKGDFGVLGLNYYSQLIHHVEELFLKSSYSAEQLLKLKDYFSERFIEFLDLKIHTITEADVQELFNTNNDQAITKLEVLDDSISGHSLPTEHDNTLLVQLREDPEIVLDFIIESMEHLSESEELLLELESDLGNNDTINTLFRICHTIKGVAGFLDLRVISKFSHELENLLSNARKGEIQLTESDISLLLSSFDILKELIEGLKQGIEGSNYEFPTNLAETYSNIITRCTGMTLVPKQKPGNNMVSSPMKVKNDTQVNVEPKIDEIATNSFHEFSEKQSPLVDESKPHIENLKNEDNVTNRNIDSLKDQPQLKTKAEDTVRVQTEKLDQLIDAIGETVIAQSMIAADPIIKDSEDLILEKKIAQSNLLIRQIQELSMSLRMVAVKGTFQKMARLVRDLSKKLDKPIEFIMEGEDTELDKTVVENIADPLMHMVRNSLDHGIETREERGRTDKPASAKLILRSYNKGGSIFIEIEDDGRGLNREVILNKAIANGIVSSDEGLSDQDIYRFIFNPGFSTAAKVTDISGRGVGMDVVKKNIEALRGSIGIQSQIGKGTIFSIRLPLTLAIIDGMVVKAAKQLYILPTLSLVETVKATNSEIIASHDGTKILKIRSSLIPLCQLDRTLGFQNSKVDLEDSIVVIVEDMVGSKLGIIVDEIIGQQQIVIKNLGKWLGEITGLSGGTIMNDGNVSLIVDIAGLIQLFQSKSEISEKVW